MGAVYNYDNHLNHGAWHLADRPDVYQPAMNNTFDFIVDLGDLIKPGVSAAWNDDGDKLEANWNQQVIRFAVNRVNIPNYHQNIITIARGNTTLKFAGTMVFDEGEIELIDYIGADGKSILKAWQNLSGNIKDETVGNAADYKKDAVLIEYSPDFKTEVRHWEIQGAWISDIKNDEMNNEGGNDKRKIVATLVFDRAILSDPDYEDAINKPRNQTI